MLSAKGVSAWLALVSLGYALLVSWLDPALPWPITFASREPWTLVFLNLVPVLILHAALLAWTRRLLMSCWITVLALGALYFINQLKLQELATPLLPDDFHFLKTIGVSYAFFSQYLASSRLQLIFAVAALGVTLLLCRERPVHALQGLPRVGIAICTVLLWISLVQGSSPWNSFYVPGRLQFEPWAPRDSAARAGLIANLLLLHWELRTDPHAKLDVPASRQLLRELNLHAVSPARDPRSPLPDIIIVQSESLFDVRRMKGIDAAIMPALDAAAQRGWSGDLYVPTFGGGTIRTEFEVLTALPLAAFPQVRYPYLQLTRGKIPSIVHELRQNGYETLAIHPNGGAFWNRNRAFRALGFDRFLDGDAFIDAPRFGWYVSDAALVDRIMAELREDGPPQLIIGISIQNHGPYDAVPLPDAERLELVGSTLDPPSKVALESYLSLLRATDAALARLVEFVDARPRDTLLLVYSDHLPPMNAVFAQLGFQDERRPEEQPVPWLLIDNRSRERRTGDRPAWLLPTLLVEKTGVNTSRYFAALTDHAAFNDVRDPTEAMKVLARLQYADELEDVLAEEES